MQDSVCAHAVTAHCEPLHTLLERFTLWRKPHTVETAKQMKTDKARVKASPHSVALSNSSYYETDLLQRLSLFRTQVSHSAAHASDLWIKTAELLQSSVFDASTWCSSTASASCYPPVSLPGGAKRMRGGGKCKHSAHTACFYPMLKDPAQLANSAKEKGENDRSVILQQREGPRRAEAPPSLFIGSLTIKIMLLNTELFNISFAIKLSS